MPKCPGAGLRPAGMVVPGLEPAQYRLLPVLGCRTDEGLDGVPHCRRYLDGAGEMNRSQLAIYLADTYSTQGEHLFAKYPSFLVFRHNGNRKWFAVIMDIPRKNLKLPGEGEISVVNLKCDTRLIGSFREEPGIFPGWHMNKAHWLSVALDGTVEDERIKFLVDMSYELTKK